MYPQKEDTAAVVVCVAPINIALSREVVSISSQLTSETEEID